MQSLVSKHISKVAKIKFINLFNIFQRLIQAIIFYNNFFIKMSFIKPFGNKIGYVVNLYFRFMYEVVFSIVNIKVVQNKNATGFY